MLWTIDMIKKIKDYKPQEKILEPKQHIQHKWLLHTHELDQTSSLAVSVGPLQRLCCQNEDRNQHMESIKKIN